MGDWEIFVDLEQTLIDSWYDKNLLDLKCLKSFLKKYNVDEIKIFSFVMLSTEDVLSFNAIKKDIEDALDVRVVECVALGQTLSDFVVDRPDDPTDKSCVFQYYTRNLKSSALLIDDDVNDLVVDRSPYYSQTLNINEINLRYANAK